MESVVPNASSHEGGTRTRRQGGRPSASSASSSEPYQRVPANSSSLEDNERQQRRRYTPLSLRFIVSKLLWIITIVLKVILYPIRKLANLLFPVREFDQNSPHPPNHAAKAFVKMFQQEYLSSPSQSYTNPFEEKAYTQIIQEIASNARAYNTDADANPPPKLLLLYIHSPLHRNVPLFLKNILCHPRILSLLDENKEIITCWGGSVHTSDGMNAMLSLHITSFPFLALVRVHPDHDRSNNTTSTVNSSNSNNRNSSDVGTRQKSHKMDLLFRMEGVTLQSTSVNMLHTYIHKSLLKYQSILSEQIMQRLQRQEEIRLREEQDREYKEALEADQRREREKREEELRREEEEHKQKEGIEREERKRLERFNSAREILVMNGPEPDAHEKGCARVRLMLPSGQRIERRFYGMDTVNVMRSFLVLYFEENNIGIENFQLNCNFPKKVLNDENATLEEEGLCPQAVVMVQDLDA